MYPLISYVVYSMKYNNVKFDLSQIYLKSHNVNTYSAEALVKFIKPANLSSHDDNKKKICLCRSPLAIITIIKKLSSRSPLQRSIVATSSSLAVSLAREPKPVLALANKTYETYDNL